MDSTRRSWRQVGIGTGCDPDPECSPGCPDNWIGDGACDNACNNAACDDDGGDCDPPSDCSPGCPAGWIGDGYCDDACNNAACNHDGGDCAPGPECSPGCPDNWIGDGYCDDACNNAACNHDGGDCDPPNECSPGCPDNWIGDGYCDDACNNSACNHDGGDCAGASIDVSADFHTATIVTEECTVQTSNTFYNTSANNSWRMTAPGNSYLEVTFTLAQAPGSAQLTVTHLSSADGGCPGGGYSPVDIKINGQLFRDNYDVAQNHGGTHGFATDQWQIGNLVRSGTNVIRIELEDNPWACTHYWIQSLEVTD